MLNYSTHFAILNEKDAVLGRLLKQDEHKYPWKSCVSSISLKNQAWNNFYSKHSEVTQGTVSTACNMSQL